MPRRAPAGTTRIAPQTLSCRVFGCAWRFGAEDRVLTWWCERGCPSSGEKTYATAEEAARMAAVLDRQPRSPLGFLAMIGGTIHRERDRR
jgi:hypothetical protein